jgi:hypothetical protein
MRLARASESVDGLTARLDTNAGAIDTSARAASGLASSALAALFEARIGLAAVVDAAVQLDRRSQSSEIARRTDAAPAVAESAGC